MSWGYNWAVKLPKSLRVWLRKRRYRKDRILTMTADLEHDARVAALFDLKREYEQDHAKILKG